MKNPENITLNISYLDTMIDYWRKKINDATCNEEIIIATCYVDAYQSVRASHGLGLLPPEKIS